MIAIEIFDSQIVRVSGSEMLDGTDDPIIPEATISTFVVNELEIFVANRKIPNILIRTKETIMLYPAEILSIKKRILIIQLCLCVLLFYNTDSIRTKTFHTQDKPSSLTITKLRV
jgi:hypothetical protein